MNSGFHHVPIGLARSVVLLLGLTAMYLSRGLCAQAPAAPASPNQARSSGAGQGKTPPANGPATTPGAPGLSGQTQGVGPASGAPLPGAPGAPAFAQPGSTLTLDQALALARSNEPGFVAAYAASRSAQLDRSIARAGLMPTVSYHNQFLYTQPNGAQNQAGSIGTQSAPRFIANNTVHEYVSQGLVTETLGLTQYNALARADAEAAIANAELEISRRGLTSTVIGLFYAYSTAQARIDIQQRAASEASDFLKQTMEREAGREAAHSDVIKAQLTLQQRQRDLADAQLALNRSRLELGVLLFADPRSPYMVALPASSPLPTRAELESAASANPELTSALGSLRARNLDITAARAGYLPDLALAYSYGIDAAQFATSGPDNVRNLGYSASVTLDLPVWDWLATEHRVKQARIFRDAAKVVLSSTQRRLIAQLDEFFAEATLAHEQLDSLDLSVRTASESLRLTRLRYTAGESSVLEVVDAQNSLTTAELGRQDGIVRYQAALANLQLLTGTI